MKPKRILMILAAVVFLFLCGVIVRFNLENQGTKKEKTDQIKTITLLAPYKSASSRQILQETAGEYENKTGGVKVQIEFVNREDYKKEINMRMDSDNSADLIICDSTAMPAFIDMGVFRDLSDYVTSEKKNSIRYQPLWESDRSNGKYYGIPFTCDPYVLFYNKDLMEAKGLSLPEKWDDIIGLCDDISDYGSHGFGFPGKSQDERTTMYTCLLYSMGGSFRNINKDGGIHALTFLQTLTDRSDIPENLINLSKEDLSYEFASGKVKMMANSLSSIKILRSQKLSFQPGVAALPRGVRSSCIFMGENIGVTKHADQETMDFLDYLYEPQVMGRITCAMSTLPLLQTDPDHTKNRNIDDGEHLADAFLENGYIVEPQDAWFEISSVISECVYGVLSDQEDESADVLGDQVHSRVRAAIIDKK